MGDQNTGLPIRSEADGADERVHVKVVDGVLPSQRMAVDSDLNAHVEVHGNDPAGADHALRMSEQGSASVDGVYHATNNSDPSQVGLVAVQRAASPADTDQIKRLSAISNGTVHALDISLHDELGASYSESNPLPVVLSESEGTAINDYKDAAAVVAAATDNHDYTVTALKTLYLTKVSASGSGKARMQISVETAVASGVFTVKFSQFNSTANPNMSEELREPIAVAAGVRVRVAMQNRDNQPQDLYSTICGHEV